MACEIFSKSAAAVKNFFRANAAALAVTIPMLAASAVAVVASQLVTDMPVVYGHFEWGIFGDALIVLILFMAALYRRCRWCAALAAVLAYANLALRTFMLVLYRETYMSTDYSSLKLLWAHTDLYAISAMLGRYCWLWLIPALLAALALVGATAYAAWRTLRELTPRCVKAWKWVTGVLLLAAVAGHVLFIRAEVMGLVYTGHLVRPLPVSAVYFLRDALRGRGSDAVVPLGETSRKLLEARGVIPPAGAAPETPRPARFDRIVVIALESLDLAFIRAADPKMPEGVTPNLDRLIAEYPSMTNFFCSSQPTSYGLTGLLMSRFDFDRECAEPEKRPSLFRIASERGYLTCYFSPMAGIFAENRRLYAELFGPERQYFLEDWSRKYGMKRNFPWGISDRELYSCVLKEMRAWKNRRFVVLISTMDTHSPYAADGITEADKKRFPTPFLRALHMADRHLGEFLREFMADKTLYDDRTLIVITADHTATHGENYTRRADLAPDRVPLIFITPDHRGVFAGLDRNKYASGIDLAPTLVNFVGGSVPESFIGRDLFSSKNMAISWLITGKLMVRAPGLDFTIPTDAANAAPERQAAVDFFRSHYGGGSGGWDHLLVLPGFLIFVLFLSAIPFAGAVCLKYRPERLFAAGLLVNGLLFYLACAANLCRAGFYVILAGNLALYIPAVAALRRDRQAFQRFFTPGAKTFHIFLAAGFLLVLWERPTQWDEFSYWCTAARYLFRHGVLNCAQGDLLPHASYPPGLPVLDVLVHKCFIGSPFRDFLPRLAVRTAMLALFTLPLGDMKKRPFREYVAAMLFFCFMAGWLFSGGIWYCESDCVLGVFFGTAVYIVMRHDRSVRDDLMLALLLAWLFLVKKAGMGFAVMTLALYAVRWIADRRGGETPKRPIWSALVVLAAPFLAQASWALLLKLHDTPIIFPVGGISPGRIWRLVFFGEPERAREIGRLFVLDMLKEFPVFAAAASMLALYMLTADERPRRKGDLLWFVPLALTVFSTMLFMTYVFLFTRAEAYRMASFFRYMDGFMMMPVTALSMLLFTGMRRERLSYRLAVSYVAMALMLIRLIFIHQAENIYGNPLTRNWPEECAALERRCGGILRAPGERFAVVTSLGGGIYHYMFRGEFEHNFVGGELLTPPDPGKPPDPSPDEVRRRLLRSGARHVLLLHPYEGLTRDYAALWETPPERTGDSAFFEVTPEGRLRPFRRGGAR